MPKTFTEAERAYIQTRLREEAKQCLILYGVRKTTVDELVRRVQIPKGTFYLFYPSKEHLLFDAICSMHDMFQEKLMKEIAVLREGLDARRLTDILFRLYQTLDESALPKLLASGEIELLFRKLPPELHARHAQMDDFRVEELLASIPSMKAARVPVFSAALRGIFLSLLYKREVGADVYDDALYVMIRGVVLQMFEGDAV
ncbi:MAG TPA: helix-turn-helix domain-containing protein [Clostridia bacterium]|nr:helix-turn-helix domain-containing protein [Clostridia bacterium]